jgi:uncharacterized protein (DUF1501 family)
MYDQTTDPIDSHDASQDAHECASPGGRPGACREYYELSRRQFLGAGATAAALAIAAGHSALPRVAFAKDHRSAQRDVIVQIYLRGASDGMSMVVPYAENAYYTARPLLAIPRPDTTDPNKCVDLDGFFGLHQALLGIKPAYDAGKLMFVHACGSKDPSRSHFDAQKFMEVGKPRDPTIATGWLGRHLQTVAPMDPLATLRGVGINTGLALTLVGGPKTLPISNLDTFGLTGAASSLIARRSTLSDMYAGTPDPLKAAASTTLQTIDTLNTINFAGYVPAGGAVYPGNSLGYAMKTSAALIKAQVGVEAIAIDYGGWDTHATQGNSTGGFLFNIMKSLGDTLGAFYADVIAGSTNSVTVIVMSEFGRRLNENGTQGTDHGHGNAMFVMGQAVLGGRVLRIWPGLAPGNLFEGKDLEVTIDYRDIVSEIIHSRLGNQQLAQVFPGYSPVFRGVYA